MLRFKDTAEYSPFRTRWLVQCVLRVKCGVSRWVGRRAVRAPAGKGHKICVFCSTIANTHLGEAKICLEILCIMARLDLLPLATTGYTKRIIGFCHNPDARKTAIWTKKPACPLLDVWTIKALQCNTNISLDSGVLTQLFINTVNPQVTGGSHRVIYLAAWAFWKEKKRTLVTW